MKSLLHLLCTSVFVLFVFSAITYSSCKTDTCKDVSCRNGGACNDGKCSCPDGYSGTLCEVTDPCKDVACLNNGVCISGLCDCSFEYTGDSCQDEIRASYYKTYAGRYIAGTDTADQWRLRVSKNEADPKTLKIESMNLIGSVFRTYMVVLTDANSFDLPEQTERSKTYKGSGRIGTTGIELTLIQKTSGGEVLISYDMVPL